MPTPRPIMAATWVAKSGVGTTLAHKPTRPRAPATAQDGGEEGEAHGHDRAEGDEEDDGGRRQADELAGGQAALAEPPAGQLGLGPVGLELVSGGRDGVEGGRGTWLVSSEARSTVRRVAVPSGEVRAEESAAVVTPRTPGAWPQGVGRGGDGGRDDGRRRPGRPPRSGPTRCRRNRSPWPAGRRRRRRRSRPREPEAWGPAKAPPRAKTEGHHQPGGEGLPAVSE